jgi:hypothetical protein
MLLGVFTLVAVLVLLVWDVFSAYFPARSHEILGALPLTLIALAYFVYQSVRRPSRAEMFKAFLLAVAFLFWSANQFWPEATYAMLFNDIAIALFVLDMFFVIVGWPATSPDESFAEIYSEPTDVDSQSAGKS